MRREVILSPYLLVLEQVEKGKIDPFDVDVDGLIELFHERAKELKRELLLYEAGQLLEAGAKLLKLKTESILGKPQKVSLKKVREVLEEREEEEPEVETDDLSWLYEYSPQVGRKKGSKNSLKPVAVDFKDFPLHKEPDWNREAKKVYEKLKKGGKIETLREFIAFLYAYQLSEDLPIPPELQSN